MNTHEIMLATAKTYWMLGKASKNEVYKESARKCLARLRKMLEENKTKTMEFQYERRGM